MRTLLLVCLALGFTVLAKAQIIPSVGLHGYLTERVDFANVDRDVELEGRSGWNAGLDVRLGKKMLYMQPGLHYFSTTTRVTDLRDVGLPRQREEQRHTSLKAPILLGLRLGLNGTAAIHLQGGPVITGAIGEELSSDLGGMKPMALGLASGVSVDFLRFNASLRYEWGQTQAFQHQPGNVDVLSLGLGIVF